MVVDKKQAARNAFSARFNLALDEATDSQLGRCPARFARGREAWVRKKWTVSNTAAGKWLNAGAIPDQAHIAVIANDLNINPNWLWADVGRMKPETSGDALLVKFFVHWDQLSPESKKDVIKHAEWMLSQQPRDKKNSDALPSHNGK